MKINFFSKIHLLSTQLWVIKIIIKFVLPLYFIILHCLRDLPGRHDKRSKFHNLIFHLLCLKWFTWVFWMFDQSLNVRSQETQSWNSLLCKHLFTNSNVIYNYNFNKFTHCKQDRLIQCVMNIIIYKRKQHLIEMYTIWHICKQQQDSSSVYKTRIFKLYNSVTWYLTLQILMKHKKYQY